MSEMNNSAGGPKTPTPGPSTSGSKTVTVARSKSEREKKIGHRRVTEGGDVTYKKIQTSQIMGSIQLGIQHAIGGLASKPERDLLMQVWESDYSSDGSEQFRHNMKQIQ
jgi:1-phosphatidylinositol-4-phosphate 5-kinase